MPGQAEGFRREMHGGGRFRASLQQLGHMPWVRPTDRGVSPTAKKDRGFTFLCHQFRPRADHHNPIKKHDVSKIILSSLLGLEIQGPDYIINKNLSSLAHLEIQLGPPYWLTKVLLSFSGSFQDSQLFQEQQLYKMPVIPPLSFTSPKSWPTYSYCLYSPLMP